MEQWVALRQHLGYSVSSHGRVRNERTGRILSISKTNNGTTAIVSIRNGGHQVKRALALLVCETFYPDPPPRFDTPIYLDGDRMNCRADNLRWRPRWFAIKHSRQFHQDLGDAGPVLNVDTGIVYQSVWDVVYEQGVLFNEVVMAAINKTYVFPLFEYFEWVNPD